MKINIAKIMNTKGFISCMAFYNAINKVRSELCDIVKESHRDDGSIYPMNMLNFMFRMANLPNSIIASVECGLYKDTMDKFYADIMDPLVKEMHSRIFELSTLDSTLSSFEKGGIELSSIKNARDDISSDIDMIYDLIEEYDKNKSLILSINILYKFYNVVKKHFNENVKQTWANHIYIFLVELNNLMIECAEGLEIEYDDEEINDGE